MNRLFLNAPQATARLRLTRAGLMVAMVAAGLVLADCKAQAPKGQVVAVVNGQEITGQDLAAEARASGAQQGQTPALVLQRVVARVLLAQSARADGLDRYPGYPSDLARIQQDFLAQKVLKTTVKPPVKPTPQSLSAFIDAHPNIFKDRMRLQADEIKFRSSDDMKSLNGADTLASVASRLQSLNVPFTRETRTIDTAELPPPLAEKLMTVPPGQIFFIRDQDIVLGVVIQNRQPVAMTPEQQNTVAGQLMSRVSTQTQIDTKLKALRAKAKIVYQPGYAPAAKPSAAAPAKAATPPG